jgi:hypothetical protein
MYPYSVSIEEVETPDNVVTVVLTCLSHYVSEASVQAVYEVTQLTLCL